MDKVRILVVDDSEIVLIGFKKVLKEAGYEVEVTMDPEKAIEMAKNSFFDIVFTDLKMGQKSGKIVCKAVKEASPSTEVVIFSGSPHAVKDEFQDVIRSGGKDYFLRKPLSSDEILDAVDKILKDKKK